jgi:Na+-translocating ferredoxin:NAD+ oxidoreductase RnfC subunit
MSRLIGRLGLAKYDVEAPIVDVEIKTKKAKIKLSQSIGAPSTACVKVGDTVKYMDVVGAFTPEKLGTAVHAPFDGKVVEVNDQFVVIEA